MTDDHEQESSSFFPILFGLIWLAVIGLFIALTIAGLTGHAIYIPAGGSR